ncbi:MAG: fibronectin type III domain-containing protein, partial [Chloroflexota bacterium]
PDLTIREVRRVLLSSVDVQPRWRPLVLTGGRLNAHSALTADESNITLLAHRPDRGGEFVVGNSSVLEVEAIAGADPATGGTMTASFENGAPDKVLRDDGSGPDETAGDGVYTASHTWENIGDAAITFSLELDGGVVASKRVPASVIAATRPTSVSAAPGDGSATVTWTAPDEVPADGLAGYRVESTPESPGGPVTVSGTSTTAVVTGLENGNPYSFRVAGFSAEGDGNTSRASNRVVPRPAPEISVEQDSLDISVDGSSATSVPLTLTNEGDGSLNFRISPRSAAEATGVSAADEEPPALVPHSRRLGGDLFTVGESGELLRIDASTGVTRQIPLPTQQTPTDAAALAATEDELFYADGLADNTIYRTSHEGEVLDSFAAPGSRLLIGLAYSDGTLHALAMDESFEKQFLVSFEPRTGELLDEFELGGIPAGGLAPAPDGNLYAGLGMSDGPPALAIVNPRNGAFLDTVPDTPPFFGLAHDRRLLTGGDIIGEDNLIMAPASFDTRPSRLVSVGELDEFGAIYGMAIATPAPWLSATPRSRTLGPGESMTVEVKVNPSSLEQGSHRARLLIEGAHADSEAVTVPVSAEVGEPPQMTLSAPDVELPMSRETTMPVSLANLPADTELARFDIRVNWDNSAADILEVTEGDASYERFDVALNRRAGPASADRSQARQRTTSRSRS